MNQRLVAGIFWIRSIKTVAPRLTDFKLQFVDRLRNRFIVQIRFAHHNLKLPQQEFEFIQVFRGDRFKIQFDFLLNSEVGVVFPELLEKEKPPDRSRRFRRAI
jgi:hypothetical protein